MAGGIEGSDREEAEAFVKDWEALRLTASSADYYFNSYNHYGVHEDILKDTQTTSTYVRALRANAHLLKGKVVLDVGAGLGLCSMLAASAGAAKVIALESQPELVAMGKVIAQKNGFATDVLEYVNSSAKELDQLPGGIEKVDVIVGDWMGYFLMYEARLDDFLCARDKWLKPETGLLFPDRAKIHISLLEDATYKKKHCDYFNSVWGFDFSPMKVSANREPVVQAFDESQLIASQACVMDADLRTCTPADVFNMASTWQVACARKGKVHAALSWFEVCFGACHVPLSIDTGPESLATCWKQTAFFFDGEPLAVKPGDKVSGMMAVRRVYPDRRNLDIKISSRLNSGKPRTQFFRWC